MIISWPDKVELVREALKNKKVLKIFVNKEINESGCVFISTSKKEDENLRGYKTIVLVLKTEDE